MNRVRAGAVRFVERERDRLGLWLPAGFATGIAGYFSYTVEPALWPVLLLFAGCLTGLWRLRASVWFGAAVFVSALVAGMMVANLRTVMVDAPRLEPDLRWAELTGRIESVERRGDKAVRLVVSVQSLEARDKIISVPERVRISVRKAPDLLPGQVISVLANLQAPPGPVIPGGYDLGRALWYQGIGATGFSYGQPKILPREDPGSLWRRAKAALERTRINLAARIMRHIGGANSGDSGAVAAALMTGRRGQVSEATYEQLRISGLAHLLAISGLHMALISGTLFWLVRALLALHPPVALNYPIRKWAACVALAGAFGYLLLSGASVSTQRAFIMVAVMCLAVMLDRGALNLRNVAIAALIILLLRPESLLSAGFQMSFAAVTALIAVYERGQLWRFLSRRTGGRLRRALSFTLYYLGGIAVTTLAAGLATAPYAAFHFNRVAVYSLLANLLAMPVMGMIVMPLALVAFVLLPLGLEGWALMAMGAGVRMVLWIAAEVAALPNAVRLVPGFSVAALVVITFGGLWLCLWLGRVRFFGLAIIGLGVFLALGHVQPDILVNEDGKIAAVRDQGQLSFAPKSSRNKFVRRVWLGRNGEPDDAKNQSPVWQCDGVGCVARPGAYVVAYALAADALRDDCRAADIIISRVPLRRACNRPKLVIDRFDLWREGAYAIYLEADDFRVKTVEGARGMRPWGLNRVAKSH